MRLLGFTLSTAFVTLVAAAPAVAATDARVERALVQERAYTNTATQATTPARRAAADDDGAPVALIAGAGAAAFALAGAGLAARRRTHAPAPSPS